MFTKTALIVDDSRTAQAVLKKMLAPYDFLVDTQRSGEDALTYLQSKTPDVIFLDHIMPGLDGFQTLKQIKSNSKTQGIPVVMYTSQTAIKYANEAKAMGAIGVLTKQLTDQDLTKIIDQIAEDIEPQLIMENKHQDMESSLAELDNHEGEWQLKQWKRLLHMELSAYQEDQEKHHRDLLMDIETRLQDNSRIPPPPSKPAVLRFMVFGLLLIIPSMLSFYFYGQQQQQQKQINSLLETVAKQNLQLATANNNMAANVQFQRRQANEKWDDMVFLLETFVAAIDQKRKPSKQIQSQKEALETTTEAIETDETTEILENTPKDIEPSSPLSLALEKI